MKNYITLGGTFLALTVIATAAEARMLGGGGGSIGTSHMSAAIQRTPLTVTDSDRHTKWKKPQDSDGGGASDPTPKTTTGKGTGGGTKVTGGYYSPRYHPHPVYPHPPHK